MPVSKIKKLPELMDIILSLKEEGKKIGFTNGCFDILHVGHVRYLAEAKKTCDVLVVGLNSDASVRSIKGQNRPVNNEVSRAEVLSALESVDLVTIFAEDTPEKLIKAVGPEVLLKGGDWTAETVVGADHVRAYGGEVIIISYVDGYSTTGIIEKMDKE